MKIYITSIPVESLRAHFLNFRMYSVIDVESIKNEFSDYRGRQEYMRMIVDQEITERLKCAKRRRKTMNIIYVTNNICKDILDSLTDFFGESDIESFIYIKDPSKEMTDTCIFDDIIELNNVKRRRVIRCQKMPSEAIE